MAEPATRRPNMIVILVDDMGFSDIGCYGSEVATPNLDKLAGRGVVFSQMYNAARCCPTRASLLTGLYPHQAGVGQMVNDRGLPAYQGYLNDRCVTIAEALKPAGYRTYMSGKWHVGGPYKVTDPSSWTPGDATHPTPVQRGFDEHYGTLCGAGSYFHPPTLSRNGVFVRPEGDFYLTDAISDRACGMIESAVGGEDPFFLYVAYTAPHWPLHARQRDIEKYRGTYAGGWDALRTARHETLKASGLLDSRWPISPRDPAAPPWQDVPDQDMQDARMAVYAAQLDAVDQGVGRILATLERLNLTEDTMILFLSDNGGCHEFIQAGARWCDRLNTGLPDGRAMRMGDLPDVLPGPEDTYQSYNLPWANASNTPFRLHKHWVHEGGISTPLIVHWPGGGLAGGVRHAPGHVVDILPTCLDAAGASYPSEYDGREITPTPGRSLLPQLRGADGEGERTLFWEHEGNCAVRQGRWKLVRRLDAGRPGPWELYDMVEDRTELSDLVDRNAPKARELEQMHARWCEQIGAVPWEQLIRK